MLPNALGRVTLDLFLRYDHAITHKRASAVVNKHCTVYSSTVLGEWYVFNNNFSKPYTCNKGTLLV